MLSVSIPPRFHRGFFISIPTFWSHLWPHFARLAALRLRSMLAALRPHSIRTACPCAADSCTLALFHFCLLALSALTHLNATLTNHLTSVDSKQLTVNLNPLESTLTKNRGVGRCYG